MPEHDTGVTHDDPRRSLIRSLRDLKFDGHVAVAAHSDETGERLQHAGADLVLLPFRDAASQAAALVLNNAAPPSVEIADPEGQKELVS